MLKTNCAWVFFLIALSLYGCRQEEEPIVDTNTMPEDISQAGSFESDPKTIPGGSVTAISETDEDGNPKMIGFKFELAMLDDLPSELNMEAPWFDLNGNGEVDVDMMATPPVMEVHGDYKVRFDPPGGLANNEDFPYRFLEFNWNPMGHEPPPWQVPHIDFHFYMMTREEVDAIDLGPAGILISEDHFARAVMPVDPKYAGPDFVNVDAAVGQMGNHLIDPASPELQPGGPLFTHAWIYGCYDGNVTFWEPMTTREFFQTKEDVELDIPLPEAYATAGWYPTRWAMTHHDDGTVTVTMTEFVYREAG